MNVDILSLAISAAETVEFSYRVRRAPDELESYINVLKITEDLVVRVRRNFREVAPVLSSEEKQWIECQIRWAQSALTEAKKIAMDSGANNAVQRGLKNLRWVMENKEAAKTHMDLISRYHTILVGIYLRLAMARELRATRGNSSQTENMSPSSPQVRKTGSVNIYEHQGKSGLFSIPLLDWGYSNWQSAECAEKGFHKKDSSLTPTPPESYGSSESLLSAPECRYPLIVGLEYRRSEVAIHQWLLKNAIRDTLREDWSSETLAA